MTERPANSLSAIQRDSLESAFTCLKGITPFLESIENKLAAPDERLQARAPNPQSGGNPQCRVPGQRSALESTYAFLSGVIPFFENVESWLPHSSIGSERAA
jgi:hypothetical protein